jgi:Flp pilus assembly protein protease CpaA
MALVALVAKIVVIPLLSRRAPQLLLELSVFDLVALGLAICAIVLARRAENRLMLTRDKRHLMTAQLGLWVGCATVIYTIISYFLWPVRQVTSNL